MERGVCSDLFDGLDHALGRILPYRSVAGDGCDAFSSVVSVYLWALSSLPLKL